MNIEKSNSSPSKQKKINISDNKIIFSKQIEELKISKRLNYLEAIMLWCENNDIEIEEIAHLVKKDSTLKSKTSTRTRGDFQSPK